jgi:lysozyme
MTYSPFSSYDPAIAIDFIRNEEGCELRSYLCPAGKWTIGYGHTAGVTDGMEISQAHAEDLLRADVIDCAGRMSSYIKAPVTKWQYIALVSLSFNVGDLRRKAPKLLHFLNAGQEDKAAHEFLDICRAGGKVVPGLKRRREKEAKLFLRTDS